MEGVPTGSSTNPGSGEPQSIWGKTVAAAISGVQYVGTIWRGGNDNVSTEESPLGQANDSLSSSTMSIPVPEKHDEPAFTPGFYVSTGEQNRQRVTNLNARISAYVKRIFNFVQEEYSRAVDLRQVTHAGIVFLAELVKIVQKIFPVPDVPIPQKPKTDPVKPVNRKTPIGSGKEEKKFRESEYWAVKIGEVLFSNKPEPKSEEAKLCQSIGGLISMLLKEGQKGAGEVDPLVAFLRDNEALNDLEKAVIKALKGATKEMNAKSFGTYKSKIIETLDGYLRETLPLLKNSSHLPPLQIQQELSGTSYLHPIFQTNKKDNIKKDIQDYFYCSLKERLCYAIQGDEYKYVRPLLASAIADQLKEAVIQPTSTRGINALFYWLIELLKNPSSSSKNSSSQQEGGGLQHQEKPFVLRTITTLLTGLFNAKEVAFLVEYFRERVIGYVDSAVGRVIKSDSTGTSLDLGLINALLNEHIKAQKNHLAPIPTKQKASPETVVEEFFRKKPNMEGGWSYFDKFINGYEGTKTLYGILQNHPWWMQNFILIVIDQALDEFLPKRPPGK